MFIFNKHTCVHKKSNNQKLFSYTAPELIMLRVWDTYLNIIAPSFSSSTSSSSLFLSLSLSVSLLSISPRGTGVKAGGERGALCCAAVDPGVHSERGEMLTQLCPARHCQRFPSILCLLNRAPVRCFLQGGDGGIMRSVITHEIHACMWNGCVTPLVHNSHSLLW